MGERRRYRRVLTTGLIVLTAVVTPLGEGGPPGVRAGQWPGCITPFLDNAVPLAVVADEGRGRVFVADWRSNRVWVVAAADGALIRSTGAGPNPGAVAIDRRVGRVFVLNTPFGIPGGGMPRSTVGVLDAATGALLRTTTVGRMDGLGMAGSLAVDETTGRAFVLNSGDHSVSVLATADGRLLGTVALPGAPAAVAVDARRHRVFVATTRGDTRVGAVAVLDSATDRVLGTVVVGIAPTQVAMDVQHVLAQYRLCKNPLLQWRSAASRHRPAGPRRRGVGARRGGEQRADRRHAGPGRAPSRLSARGVSRSSPASAYGCANQPAHHPPAFAGSPGHLGSLIVYRIPY